MQKLGYKLRIKLIAETPFFGPGVLELLDRLKRTGSLHTAAAEMGMAYSKAWRMIRDAEKALEFPLTVRRVGGTGGGSSQLTEEGEAFLECFRSFQREMTDCADRLFERYFGPWAERGKTEAEDKKFFSNTGNTAGKERKITPK